MPRVLMCRVPPEASIECLVAASGLIVFALNNNHLHTFSNEDGVEPQGIFVRALLIFADCDLSKVSKSLKVRKVLHLFLDASGTHLLIKYGVVQQLLICSALTLDDKVETEQTVYMNIRNSFGRVSMLKAKVRLSL